MIDWKIKYRENIWHPYTQEKTTSQPLAVISAKDVRITLDDNRELIDAISSWWVMCHGHSHPHITQAVKNQIDQLPHIMFAGLAHRPAYMLASKLINILPKGSSKVFYSDSGSIAVEIALKIAKQYWQNQNNYKKTKFIAFKFGYHGDTQGAMSVSDNNYHRQFGKDSNTYFFDLPQNVNQIDEFKNQIKKVKDTVAALIIEPLVQGAGGMKFHTHQMLKIIYEICKEYKIIFIADEIATGFGRTGTMFACEQASITPDIICIGKALTGGVMTLAATIVTDEIYRVFYSDDQNKAFNHGPTYMANPLACAASIASLELFENEPRLLQVQNIQNRLQIELCKFKSHKSVRDIRVLGAIGVIEFVDGYLNIALIRDRLALLGVWLRPFGNIIYIMPPFTISDQDIELIFQAIDEVI